MTKTNVLYVEFVSSSLGSRWTEFEAVYNMKGIAENGMKKKMKFLRLIIFTACSMCIISMYPNIKYGEHISSRLVDILQNKVT